MGATAALSLFNVKKRWIVERTFGWLRWSRQLVQEYAQLPENAEARVKIAMIPYHGSAARVIGYTLPPFQTSSHTESKKIEQSTRTHHPRGRLVGN